MRSHRSSRLARSQRVRRLSPETRALRALAAGSLAGAISAPVLVRADESSTRSTAPVNNATTARLTPPENGQNSGQGPRVSIVSPSYADAVRGDTAIVVAVEASDAPTKSVQLFVDGVSASGGGAIAFENLPSAQFNWQTSKFKDGQHTLSVRVTDANGFIGQADTQVYINNGGKTAGSAPKLQWMNAHDGDLLHGQADLQLQASGNYGVKYIVITVNSIASPDRTPPLRASLVNRAPYIYSLDTTRLPDGVYVLKARVYDALQNQSETQQVTFGVSNNGLNPTVVERLNEVLDKQKPQESARTTKVSGASSTRNAIDDAAATQLLTPQTRHEARVASRKTTSDKAAPVIDKTAEKVIAVKAAPKTVIAPSVAKTVVATKKIAPSPAVKTVATVKTTVAAPHAFATKTTPHATPVFTMPIATRSSTAKLVTTEAVEAKSTKSIGAPTRVASVAAIKPAPVVEATQLILPDPSLTAAPLSASNSAAPSAAKAFVADKETTTHARISVPVVAPRVLEARVEKTAPVAVSSATSSTRFARNDVASAPASPFAVAESKPWMTMAAPDSAAESVATTKTVASAKTVAAKPEVANDSVHSAISLSPELRKSRPILGVVPTKADAPKVVEMKVVEVKIVEAKTVEAKVAETEVVATKLLAPAPLRLAKNDALKANLASAPVLTAATYATASFGSALSIKNIQPAPAQVPQRLAMLNAPRRDFSAAETTSVSDATSNRNVFQGRIAPLHMTTAILSPSDSVVAESSSVVRAVRGDQTRIIRQLVSLPTNLGTPNRSGTNTPRPGASITMSPVTLAALGARGAAGTLPALHIVGKGETLGAVANRYGLPVNTLATVNNISVKAILKEGDKLSLPRALNFRLGGGKPGDIGALMVGDTSAAPFRFLFEQQGGTVTWDNAHQRITATNGDNQVTLSIGSREATVNDQKVMMDLAAFLLSGRTMVPIRFFEKALQAQVQWEPSTGRIYISMSNG